MQNQENLEEKLPKNTNKKEICKKKNVYIYGRGKGERSIWKEFHLKQLPC